MTRKASEKAILIRRGIWSGFLFFLTIYWAMVGNQGFECPSNFLTATGPCSMTNGFFEYLVWGLFLVLFIVELYWSRAFISLLHWCQRVWPVFVFILWAIVSIAWSPVFEVSLSRVLIFIVCSLAAIYFGSRSELGEFVTFLAWAFALVSLASLLAAWIWPEYGVSSFWFYHGAWTGIFWHRNYLGVFMVIAMTLDAVKLFNWKSLSAAEKILWPACFVLSAFLLVKSKSATGLLSAVAVMGTFILLALWLRFQKKLKKIHYIAILAVLLSILTLAMFNLDKIFALVGRNTSLTGRVPMWQYLFQNVIALHPLQGYGFDAIWHLTGFRSALGERVAWGTQVLIGDNGLIDIWLNLGLVGVILMCGLLVLALINSVKYFLRERTMLASWPFLLLVFTLIANISLSLMLQSELFVWSAVLVSQVILLKKT
jgi:O-antigen ligase